MNRLVCTTVALLVVMAVATPSRTSAQDLGVLVGFNSANVDFDVAGVNVNVDPRSGFVGGLWFNQPLMDGFSVEIDGLVSMKGTAFNFDGDSGKIKLTYFDIPVLARANLPGSGPVRIHLLGGPSFNFKLSESFEPEEDQSEDQVEAFETALVVGGGVTVSRLRIDARYGFGLTNIAKDEDEDFTAKNRVFSILFGISFR